MTHLILTDNRKTKFTKHHYNTFGLMYGLPSNGGTCPNATTDKGGCCSLKKEGGKLLTCYMSSITNLYPQVKSTLEANTKMLEKATPVEMEEILTNTVIAFLAKGGVDNPYFRLHYSGDFFSRTYCEAWVKVMQKFPKIIFWGYTRSWPFLDILTQAKNLRLYLSMDPVNQKDVLHAYKKYNKRKNLALAWMGNNPPAISDVKFVTCPEVSNRIKNTPDMGACGKCKLCMTCNDKIKLRNIHFPIH